MLKTIAKLFQRTPVDLQWHGEFLCENDLVADVLAKVKSDPEALKRWRDPASWQMNFSGRPYWWRCMQHNEIFVVHHADDNSLGCKKCIALNQPSPAAPHRPDHEGCLHYAGMSIRNYYGLWDKKNPYTLINPPPNAEGIIDHPLHPDNLSGRIIDRVRKAIGNA